MLRLTTILTLILVVALWLTAPAPSRTAACTSCASLSGRLQRVDGDVLTLVDGEGEHAFRVDAATQVERPAGHVLVVDHDVARLQVDDSLFVGAHVEADHSLTARSVDANVFVTRQGLITARGDGYLDLRLRPDRLATDYEASTTRILLAAAVNIERLLPGGDREALHPSDLRPGMTVAFQGFVADDGAWVATFVYPEATP